MSAFPVLARINNRGNRNPAVNLAIEEYITRNLKNDRDYLFLYRNTPSVIIGKHQNPFLEVNMEYLRKHNLPLYRRISGGGTVYHDEGNINVSFITAYSPQQFNNYLRFLQPIIELLVGMGTAARLAERNDIHINGLKVSGNAQFSSRDRMLSHGTLLFDADLDALRRSLRVHEKRIETKSRPSVRSSVTNIKPHITQMMSVEQFEQALYRIFPADSTFEFSDEEWQYVGELARSKYDSWEWNFGRTPVFTVTAGMECISERSQVQISVREGKIERMVFAVGDAPCARLIRVLTGRPYMPDTIRREFETAGFCSEKQLTDLMRQLF